MEAGISQPGVRQRAAGRSVLGGAISRRFPTRLSGAIAQTAHGIRIPRATAYLVDSLLARKSKVLMAWLNGTNPVVNPAVNASGLLTFENAAERAGVAKAAERYTIEWSRFDNATGTDQPAGDEQPVANRGRRRRRRCSHPDPSFSPRVRAVHPIVPHGTQPIMMYFRQTEVGWKLVGLERNP